VTSGRPTWRRWSHHRGHGGAVPLPERRGHGRQGPRARADNATKGLTAPSATIARTAAHAQQAGPVPAPGPPSPHPAAAAARAGCATRPRSSPPKASRTSRRRSRWSGRPWGLVVPGTRWPHRRGGRGPHRVWGSPTGSASYDAALATATNTPPASRRRPGGRPGRRADRAQAAGDRLAAAEAVFRRTVTSRAPRGREPDRERPPSRSRKARQRAESVHGCPRHRRRRPAAGAERTQLAEHADAVCGLTEQAATAAAARPRRRRLPRACPAAIAELGVKRTAIEQSARRGSGHHGGGLRGGRRDARAAADRAALTRRSRRRSGGAGGSSSRRRSRARQDVARQRASLAQQVWTRRTAQQAVPSWRPKSASARVTSGAMRIRPQATEAGLQEVEAVGPRRTQGPGGAGGGAAHRAIEGTASARRWRRPSRSRRRAPRAKRSPRWRPRRPAWRRPKGTAAAIARGRAELRAGQAAASAGEKLRSLGAQADQRPRPSAPRRSRERLAAGSGTLKATHRWRDHLRPTPRL
jgi:hypothetical protein